MCGHAEQHAVAFKPCSWMTLPSTLPSSLFLQGNFRLSVSVGSSRVHASVPASTCLLCVMRCELNPSPPVLSVHLLSCLHRVVVPPPATTMPLPCPPLVTLRSWPRRTPSPQHHSRVSGLDCCSVVGLLFAGGCAGLWAPGVGWAWCGGCSNVQCRPRTRKQRHAVCTCDRCCVPGMLCADDPLLYPPHTPTPTPLPAGSAVFSVAKVDAATGEIAGVFESIQPSDTDLGAKAPKDVKITGLWYAQLK